MEISCISSFRKLRLAIMYAILPFSPDLAAWLSGLATGLGLFAAVGAQSAFILRQGVMRAHVGSVLAVCAASDVLLIFCSVRGAGALIERAPWLVSAMAWGGAVFLAVYAVQAGRRALRTGQGLVPAAQLARSRRAAVTGALAFTLLNPHFWLDMVLVGTLAHGFGDASMAYAGGAMTASVLWLLVLGGGARLLAPVFRDARAWRVLDGGVAMVMASLAVRLALRAL
jgi:L-lysine exporter family protein LysE/ArgO